MQAPIMLHRDTEFDTLHPRENLEQFLRFCSDVVSRYEGNIRECEDMDNKLNDLLHYIEMTDDDDPNISLAVRESRRQRRLCKNENDLLRPLYDFLSDKTFTNKLSQVLGRVRAAKETVENRTYITRTTAIEELLAKQQGQEDTTGGSLQ